MTAATTGRLATARRALAVVEAVAAAHGANTVLEAVAAADLAPSPDAVGRSLRTARSVASAVQGVPWDVVVAALALGGAFAAEATRLGDRLRQRLVADQLAVALEPGLVEIRLAASALLARAAKREPAPVPDRLPKPPDPAPGPGVEHGAEHARTREEAEALLERLRGRLRDDYELSVNWELRPRAKP